MYGSLALFHSDIGHTLECLTIRQTLTRIKDIYVTW